MRKGKKEGEALRKEEGDDDDDKTKCYMSSPCLFNNSIFLITLVYKGITHTLQIRYLLFFINHWY
jgi:hypothetical protein